MSFDHFILFANPDEARVRVVVAIGALIALCLIAGAAILIARRKLLSPDQSAVDQGSLLDQLRGMRDRGEMSQAEYDQTKAAMLSKLRSDIGPLSTGRKISSPPIPGGGQGNSPNVKRGT